MGSMAYGLWGPEQLEDAELLAGTRGRRQLAAPT